MSEIRGKRKRGERGTELETEKKRETKRGKKEKEEQIIDEGEREREREQEEEMTKRRKEEEEKKKRFECGICLELMSWEKEPRLLPCCGLSFCFLCLNKLFLLQNPSSSSSSPSPSSSSSSSSSSSPSSSSSSLSKKGVKCPVCREMNECETIGVLEMNYLIPETIDVLLSSNLISFSNQSGDESECVNFETCGERTRMFCFDCKVFVCDSCDPSHTSTIFTRNHKRFERDGDDGRRRRLEVVGLENLKKRECSKHPSETISGYCFRCSSFVCVCCILETHDEHNVKVKSIEESILEKRNEVEKIGDKLERRLFLIEKKRKEVEEEVKELEEKLEEKRIEKKEIELEKEDLRIRKDSIIRLSNTSTDDLSLFFDDQLFSTLLQTAKEIVSEARLPKPKKGVICCDGGGDSFRLVSYFPMGIGTFGMSVNSDGNIFICDEEGLRVRDKEGNEMIESTIQKTIDSLQLKPVDVSIGWNDQIVVLDWSRVVLLNEEGEWIKSFGSEGSEDGQFNSPCGVEVDEKGRIIVADTHNHRIQVFDHEGSFIRSFGSRGSSEGQFNEPRSVGVDGDGNIVISDFGNHRIQVIGIEGNFIRCFGTRGSGDSQLDGPIGVDVDGGGRIVVCELGNGRVSVFEKDGTFLFSFGEELMGDPQGVVVDSFGTILISDWEKMSLNVWKPF